MVDGANTVTEQTGLSRSPRPLPAGSVPASQPRPGARALTALGRSQGQGQSFLQAKGLWCENLGLAEGKPLTPPISSSHVWRFPACSRDRVGGRGRLGGPPGEWPPTPSCQGRPKLFSERLCALSNPQTLALPSSAGLGPGQRSGHCAVRGASLPQPPRGSPGHLPCLGRVGGGK